MDQQRARAAGYCSAKGRLLATGILLRRAADTWWWLLPQDRLPGLVKRLRMFVLRARCTVQALDDHAVVTLAATVDLLPWHCDPATARIAWWGGRDLAVVHASKATALAIDEQALQRDIAAGWPWVTEATVEQFVPQMVNFELLQGVNFRKGCYPGQEVVARSQYRGTLKRRMFRFAVATADAAAGQEIFHSSDAEQPAGMVVQAAPTTAGAELLAELRWATRDHGSLHLGSAQGPALQELPLPYAVPLEATDESASGAPA